MKRIDVIKNELCEKIKKNTIEEFGDLLFEFHNINGMSEIAIKHYSEFDNRFFGNKSDEEMAIIMKSGEYDSRLKQWLSEEI